jgi:general secretion pathway protein B
VSLILDALRRADAERDRGAVPGLHAQPLPLPSAGMERPARAAPWRWIAAAIAVLLLGVLAWILGGREAGRAGAVASATHASSGPQSAAPAARTVPASPPVTLPPAAPAPQAREPLPVAEPAPWPSPEPRKAAASAPVAAPSPAASAAAPAQPVPREQLPENVRAQLPPLAVGGSIHSAAAADRSLILDGRIYREGDRLSPDLKLERIGARTAVLQFKGYRFEIAY